MYVDDTSLLVTSNTLKSSVEKENAEIKDAIRWFVNNSLILNETKRFYLFCPTIDHSLLEKR